MDEDFLTAIDLLRRLADINIQKCTIANLGAGNPDSAFTPQFSALSAYRLINVEIHGPSLVRLDTEVFWNSKSVDFVLSDMLAWAKRQPDKSVDVCILCDSIEHLAHYQALQLLEHLKRITRKRILIWLPFGECRQEEYGGNPYQIHLSTWYPEDFIRDGAKVEYFKDFHKHFSPPVSAGWVYYDFSE